MISIPDYPVWLGAAVSFGILVVAICSVIFALTVMDYAERMP